MNIIELANEAGIRIDPKFGEIYTGNVQLQRFANLVIEECAKVCESQEDFEYATGKVDHNERSWCSHLAQAIREMKK